MKQGLELEELEGHAPGILLIEQKHLEERGWIKKRAIAAPVRHHAVVGPQEAFEQEGLRRAVGSLGKGFQQKRGRPLGPLEAPPDHQKAPPLFPGRAF